MTKLLWLSDIHFRQEYKDYLGRAEHTVFNRFIDGFVDTVNELSVDSIVITGDIAFAGTETEYQAFKTNILDKISEKKHIVVIPGNHDVSFKQGIINTWVKDNTTGKQADDYLFNRNAIIENHTALYKRQFEHYTNFAKSLIPAENIKMCSDYKEERLFGYYIDHSNKLLFVLINTAWFSLGDTRVFNKALIDYARETEIDALNMLAIKEKSTEFGTQIVGRELLKASNIEKEIGNYPDYTIITCMHHPLHWLDWDEYHTNNQAGKVALTINRILSNTDILLTGHEHLPAYTLPQKVGAYWHLQAGMFMDNNYDTKDNADNFSRSRFSILQIEKGYFSETSYAYNFKIQDWQKQNINQTTTKDSGCYALPRVAKHIFKLSATNRNELQKTYFQNQDNCKKMLQKMLNSVLPDSLSSFKKIDTKGNNTFRCFYTSEGNDNNGILLLLPLEPSFYNETLIDFTENNLHFLDPLLKNFLHQKKIITKIFIFAADICIDDGLCKEYENCTSRENRNKILSDCIHIADHYFNNFRSQLFSRYETDDTNSARIVDFESIAEIRLINYVVPHWKIAL